MKATDSTRLFTSESVTAGHPDKLCDQISDAICDDLLAQDKSSRVAIEALVTPGQVHVAGEARTGGFSEIPEIVRDVLLRVGYDRAEAGIDGYSCGVSVSIHGQSPNIAGGVEQSWEARSGSQDRRDQQGAGDQGLMFGYASDETDSLMPMPIHAAHQLVRALAKARQTGLVEGLRPDGKSQVTVRYQNDSPVAVAAVVLSAQHEPGWQLEQLRQVLLERVIEPTLVQIGLPLADGRVLVNPAGRFEIGGPAGDTGLTGRKIIVDTYGGMARHGGGALSGKDPSKVDRSGAYAARWVAKNLVAAGLAKRCEVQVAYAIGAARPVGIAVDSFGTGQVPDSELVRAVAAVFDLRPLAIIEELDLLNCRFLPTAAYGHFGRVEPGFSWEQTNRVAALQAVVGA
ncbi:MAG: methionine adenosyltransferase [Bifidobacteriaceae bacterium]|jgi:S-adenosylmethionine synthetase|nr:methionine adenosyltransferase [Bifidobacteriaceae bacterium]